MAETSSIPIYGPSLGNQGCVVQMGSATLVAGTVSVTVPRKLSPTNLGADALAVFVTKALAATAAYTAGWIHAESVSIAADGTVTFNIVSMDDEDTDTVCWVVFMAA